MPMDFGNMGQQIMDWARAHPAAAGAAAGGLGGAGIGGLTNGMEGAVMGGLSGAAGGGAAGHYLGKEPGQTDIIEELLAGINGDDLKRDPPGRPELGLPPQPLHPNDM